MIKVVRKNFTFYITKSGMNISENLKKLQSRIENYPAKLIAVSKTKPVSLLKEAYQAGIRDFGENRVQEMVEKYEALPKDIHWHLIGHLQRNKVKYIVPFVHLIHAVDSLNLLQEINKRAEQNNRVIGCLLQIHIAEEETKFGFSYTEVEELFSSEEIKALKSIQILGLMGMATNTANQEQVNQEFKQLKDFFDRIKVEVNLMNVNFQELSMGMSGDYELALKNGSTMIRVGSAIFGARAQ